MATVYVDLSQCIRAAHVISAIEQALVAAGERAAAEVYAAQMRALHPHTPETAALHAPACVVYTQQEEIPCT